MARSEDCIIRIHNYNQKNLEIRSPNKCCVFKDAKGNYFLAFKRTKMANIQLLTNGKTIYLEKFSSKHSVDQTCKY